MRTTNLFFLAALAALVALGCVRAVSAVDAPAPIAPSGAIDAGAGPNPVALQMAQAMADAGLVLDAENPLTCVACHTAIVGEWMQSMHAHAHQTVDPLYAAVRTARLKKQGPGIAAQCSTCHHPRSLEDPESKVARQGVSCATCHELTAAHVAPARSGAGTLARGPAGVFRGQLDLAEGASPLHGTGPALPELKDGQTLCLACHGREENPAGVPTCTTGEEFAVGAGPDTCVSCHMAQEPGPSGPVVQRTSHRSHSFAGPHRAWLQDDGALLAKAVSLSGRFEGERLTVKIENHSGHGFPTGFPARMAVLVLRGLDDQGTEVWRNVKTEPAKEHPEAVFNKVYQDDAGVPVLAPFATRLARDSRLKPNEQREIVIAVPASVRRVEATMRFWLLAPPAARALGLEARPEALPKTIVSATFGR